MSKTTNRRLTLRQKLESVFGARGFAVKKIDRKNGKVLLEKGGKQYSMPLSLFV